MNGLSQPFELRRATAEMMPRVYALMAEIFAADWPLMQRVIAGSVVLPGWEHFVVCRRDEIVSHAALVHMRIWLDQRPQAITGVASVLTRPAYRRQGLARKLLDEILSVADASGEGCVLFTSLPEVYQPCGFHTIGQGYRLAEAASWRRACGGLDIGETTELDATHLAEMTRIYVHEYPNHDGKLVREANYWPFCQTTFNTRDDVCLVFCEQAGRMSGYMRCERENQVLLVTELCSAADAGGGMEALLEYAFHQARSQDLPFVGFALPEAHTAWSVLASGGVQTTPDQISSRELFMARPRSPDDRLSGLRWSLADKF